MKAATIFFLCLPVAAATAFAQPTAGKAVPRGGPPRVLAEHDSPVLCLAWSPDGRRLAAGTQGGTVYVTEAATGKKVASIPAQGAVGSVAFSPDGKSIALCLSEQAKISVWQVDTGKQVREFSLFNSTADHVTITPDGLAVEGVAVGRVWYWTLDGRTGGSMASGNAGGGCSAISPDGAASGWCDSQGSLQMRRHQPGGKNWVGVTNILQVGKIGCLGFGPAGKLIAVGDDKGVHLWDAATRKKTTTLTGLEKSASRLAFSLDGRTLAALAGDGASLLVWDLGRNAPRCQVRHGLGAVVALAVSPDGKALALASKGDKGVFLAKTAARELSARGTPVDFSDMELAELWDDLANPDATKADAAWRKLGEAGDHTVPFLREKTRPIAVPRVDMSQIEKWVADLDSPKYPTRERATRELLGAGELAVVPIQKMLEKNPSGEAKNRAALVLKKIEQPVRSPDRLRVLEAIDLLERLRTAPAVALLEEIGRDALIGQIRREAIRAVRRVGPLEKK
jgi:WD40 repeat protein